MGKMVIEVGFEFQKQLDQLLLSKGMIRIAASEMSSVLPETRLIPEELEARTQYCTDCLSERRGGVLRRRVCVENCPVINERIIQLCQENNSPDQIDTAVNPKTANEAYKTYIDNREKRKKEGKEALGEIRTLGHDKAVIEKLLVPVRVFGSLQDIKWSGLELRSGLEKRIKKLTDKAGESKEEIMAFSSVLGLMGVIQSSENLKKYEKLARSFKRDNENRDNYLKRVQYIPLVSINFHSLLPSVKETQLMEAGVEKYCSHCSEEKRLGEDQLDDLRAELWVPPVSNRENPSCTEFCPLIGKRILDLYTNYGIPLEQVRSLFREGERTFYTDSGRFKKMPPEIKMPVVYRQHPQLTGIPLTDHRPSHISRGEWLFRSR
jgi:hypothetical protein